jgi:hypothetical protein
MTTDKDFKRLVRARMQKTGESYTAARAHFVARTPSPAATRSPAVDYAALAGRSDAAVKTATGCGWERWVRALDHVQAYTWPHREIAAYLREKYEVPGWWSQSVTVGYERIKGLRAAGQRRDGSFEANKSRTFAVPLVRLYRAWHDSRTRSRWLPDVKLTVRTATRGKYMRLVWPDRTMVLVGFIPRGPEKSQVAVAHGNLPDRAAVARAKEYWTGRLDALGEVLAGG